MSLEQRQRRLLNLGTVLLVILLVVAAIGALISVGRTNRVGGTAGGVRGSLSALLQISTREQGSVNCPFGAAYSPDGGHIAIIGTQATCAPHTTSLTPHVAVIYDAHSGVMTLYARLEQLIGIDTTLPLAQEPVRAVNYFSLGWAPDGHHLAIIFTAFTSEDIITTDTEWDAGLIVLDTERGTARVLHGDSGFFALPGSPANGFPIWNVATGAEVSAFSPDSGLAYAWNARGMPYPIVKARGSFNQLPITAGPRYPIGNPDGNSTFTIWQPGLILGSGANVGAAIFTTVFPSWSPDGQYVTLITAGAQLPLAQQPTVADSSAAGRGGIVAYPTPSVMPSTPARDPALIGVQRHAGTSGWALVAWNPAGTLLASVDCTSASTQTLEIRATDSAIIKGSATLPLTTGDTGCRNLSSGASAFPAQPMMLLWSPSGDRVMVCDQKAGTLTIWSTEQSPA